MFCKCNQPRKCYPLKDWRVIRYQYTTPGYSRVKCLKYPAEQLKFNPEPEPAKAKKGKKGSFSSRPETEIGTGCRAGKQGRKIVK